MGVLLIHPFYGLAIVLFSLILATGMGSLLSTRAVPLSRLALVAWPFVLAVYLTALPFWLGPLLCRTETGALIERAAVCLLTIVPAGVLMGFMFPAGMRLCVRIEPRAMPWLWAVNGAAGVLASGLAVLVSIETSLDVATWIGAAAYAAAAGVGVRLLPLGRTYCPEHGPRAIGRYSAHRAVRSPKLAPPSDRVLSCITTPGTLAGRLSVEILFPTVARSA